MKTMRVVLILLCGLAASASAQQYSSSTQLQKRIEPTKTRPYSTAEPLRPRPTGVIYEMSERGLVIISPTAPASYGVGQNYLTANPFPGNFARDNANERHFDYGGIKLIGWNTSPFSVCFYVFGLENDAFHPQSGRPYLH